MAEPLKATFFTLNRRDRAVLLPATLVFLILIALIVAAFAALNWGTLLHFQELFSKAGTNEQLSEEQSLSMVTGVFGLMGWAFLFAFPLYLTVAAYEAACLRWMIRGETPGLFGLTIDNDVWRVYGVYWCWFIAQFAVSTAVSILTLPLMFMTMGEIAGNPSADAMMRWQLSVQLPLMILQYIPLIFIGVRFGPAAATSVLRNRFSYFDAWKVTEGRFWALFGSFALLWLLVAVACVIIFAGTYGILLGDLLPRVFTDWTSFPAEELGRRIISPQGFTLIGVAYVANIVVFFVYAVLSYGVNARAAIAAQEDGKITPYVET